MREFCPVAAVAVAWGQGIMRNYEEQGERANLNLSTTISLSNDPRSRPANSPHAGEHELFYCEVRTRHWCQERGQVNDQKLFLFFFSSCRSDGQGASERTHDESARLRNIGVVARLTPNMRRRGNWIRSARRMRALITNQPITYIIRRCDVM